MIRNIFIPDSMGNYYLVSKKIVGFDIGKTEIYATVVTAKGRQRTVDTVIEEKLSPDPTLSYDDKVTRALTTIASRIGNFDSAYSALSSSLVVFKELTLPFMGSGKIKMVLPFEVEPLLPFPLDTAVVDAIVTDENPATKQSDVIIAAVKKEYIENHLKLFSNAGIALDKISVDLFELYGLCSALAGYKNKSYVLADIGTSTTRLGIVLDGQLKYIRTLGKGIPPEVRVTNSVQQTTSDIVQDIQLTVTGYLSKLKGHSIASIILTGSSSEIPGFSEELSKALNAPIDFLNAKKMIHNGIVKSKTATIPSSALVSLATALSSNLTQDFNLQQVYESPKKQSLLNWQIIAALSLTVLTLLSFLTYSLVRIRNLKKANTASQTETINKLKSTFDLPAKSTGSLNAAKRAAQEKLTSDRKKWLPLSEKSKSSFLKYLYELSRNINRQELGLNLNSITMDHDEIILTGKVKNYDALTKLESQLKSDLFEPEESLQTPEFITKPIRLKIIDKGS